MSKGSTRLKTGRPAWFSRIFTAKIIVTAALCVIAVTAGVGYALFASASQDLPQITSLKNYKPPIGTQIFSEDDHLIGRIKVDKGIFVPLSQVPVGLRKAVVAVEDARFYEHKGIDIQGILRAAVKDILSVSFREGGSTITQQLAKVLFLTPEKSIKRKITEVMLARKMEQGLTKDEILELYLNKIYLGHGAYGVEMAARTYFGKHVGDLTLAECAMVAGLIRSPMSYSPYSNMKSSRNRQKTVLGRMVDEKLITRGQADNAMAQPITLRNMRVNEEVAPYLVEQIRIYLEKKYGPEKVYVEGLTVRTAINYRLQQYAVRALQDGIRALDKRQGWRGPLSKKDPEEVEKLRDDPLVTEAACKPGEIVTATVLRVDDAGAVVSVRGGKGFIAWDDMKWAAGKDAAKKKPKDVLAPGFVVEARAKSLDKKAKRMSFTLEQEPASQGAIVAIDPWEGKVKAIVGGVDFQKSEFNHAVGARRQPGSAFKPFVYAAAMESGFTPASVIED
ncbi:MAG TPA: transglycosylase domain-containing protein, partial [Nitrospirota bacterium]|nr:transglycosylase domain-containing protein [Nitrospirota bacterium]